MIYETFNFQVHDAIGIITLEQPPKNSLNHQFFTEFSQFSQSILAQANLSGLVIMGEGKHFSAGADTSELGRLLRGFEQAPEFLLENSRSFARLESAPYPVVAAISGCCLGAGLELALACHYRIASPSAMLAFPESGFGLMPGCGGTVRSLSALALGKAIDLILSARNLLADEAFSLGLVDVIVAREALLETSLSFIRRVRQ